MNPTEIAVASAEVIVSAFKEPHVTIPGQIKAGQSGIELFWEFDKMQAEFIRHVEPSCNCTASVMVTPKGIKAVYADTHQAAKSAQSFTKVMTIVFNTSTNAEPLKVNNAKGAPIWNPTVPSMTISFGGEVAPI